jgi:hypothetical protein
MLILLRPYVVFARGKALAKMDVKKRFSWLSPVDPVGTPVADLFINVSPVFKTSIQNRLGHAIFQVSHDI